MCVLHHAHIENIKTVANLMNNKDVFMCILRLHAHAGSPHGCAVKHDPRVVCMLTLALRTYVQLSLFRV